MSRDLRIHSIPTRSEQIRTLVEIIAIVAAGIWALYTFVYEQRIKPLSEAPEFTLPTIVNQGPTVNGVVFLTIHKRVENNGNTPIDLAAEAITVYGEILEPAKRVTNRKTATSAVVIADVPRKPVRVLYSYAKLRSGSIGGDQTTSFFLPAHSANEETFLVAVPAKRFPVVLVERIDYVEKAPIAPKIPMKIIRTPLGAYQLDSPEINGEYDSQSEYPIKP